MNKNVLIGIVAVFLVLGLGVWYFGSNPKSQAPNPKESEFVVELTPIPTVGSGMVVDTSVVEATVVGSEFKFVPSEIKVKKGTKLKVIFQNSGGMHDFVLDEYGVKTAQIGAGKEETVEFVADKLGTFEYYCSVGKHRQMGMVGKLIVE